LGEKKLELIELDDAVQFLWDVWQTEKPPYKKATIYNWIHAKVVRNYGSRFKVQLDKKELLKKKGPNR
jgi:hypothetical protein